MDENEIIEGIDKSIYKIFLKEIELKMHKSDVKDNFLLAEMMEKKHLNLTFIQS